jgi:MFS transporter, DHA1 family, multidrug resistance protein
MNETTTESPPTTAPRTPVESDRGPTLRSILRVEVIAICCVAFLADIMSGILGATFSLFAEDLGASVFFIGILTSITGLTALLGSIPIGVISDRIGRVRVLTFGLGCFGTSMVLLAISPSPALLIPGRLLLGVAMVASFWIAAAYLGDNVAPNERGLAFGLLTTSMGLGFTVGPLVGGYVADGYSTRVAYGLAAGVGAIGVAVIQLVLRKRQPRVTAAARPRVPIGESLRVGRQRTLIAVGIANVLAAVAFGGAVATIFPLRGRELGITDAAIGTMFAVRAIASTCVRLPSGALTGIIGSRKVVFFAIVIEMIAVAGIGTTDRSGLLYGWLVLEGIGYGAFLTSAQAYLAEHTVEQTRGAAIGFYSMTGGIGNTLAPLALGGVADVFSLTTAFFVSSSIVAVGLLAIGWMWFRAPDARLVGSVDGQGFAQGGLEQ